MAVMGRKKQMIKRIILNRRSKEKGLNSGGQKEIEERGISEEEHQRRLKLLREMGISTDIEIKNQ